MRELKFYFFATIFILTGLTANAQEDKPVNISLTVSPSVAWFAPGNSGYTSDGSRLGIKYGLLTDFRLFGVANYSLTTGFTMNHIGGKMIEPSTFTESSGVMVSAKDAATYKLTYIDVPFAIRLKTNEIGYNTFYAVFGSEVGFNIAGKKDFTTTYGNSTTGEFSNDVSGEINLFRSSLVFGVGIERNISGNTNYRIGLTYHNGLTNVMQGPGSGDNDGKAYAVDGNGNTIIANNEAVYDKKLSTKLKFIELNLAILF